MGPNLLVDKSTIQGLSGDEIKILHRYYRVVVSPILIRELSSFLAKIDYGKEELQHRLQIFAKKTDSIDAAIPEDEKTVIYNELIGNPIPMDGFTIPRTGGKIVKDEDGVKGIFFDEQEERKILRNWADGQFLDSDFVKAKEIRNFDLNVELKKWQDIIDKNKNKASAYKTISAVVKWVDDEFLPSVDNKNLLLLFVLKYLGVNVDMSKNIIFNWQINKRTTLKESAPYSFFFCRLLYIFYFSSLNGLIQINENNKNHIDVQYLFYLPFSNVFTSGDGFFKQISNNFLRDDQVFIDTKDLKKDLQEIINFFDKQSPEEKKTFDEEFGIYPPDLKGSITAELWKKHMKPKPPKAGITPKMTEEEMAKVKRRLKSIIDDANRQN